MKVINRNMYMIFCFLDSVCDAKNETDFYVPHEKMDGCRSYIRCTDGFPVGFVCHSNLCWNHNIDDCDHCYAFTCESEMNPTTQGKLNFLD